MSANKRAKRIKNAGNAVEEADQSTFSSAVNSATGTMMVLSPTWGEKTFWTAAKTVVANALDQSNSANAFLCDRYVDDAQGRLAGCSAAYVLQSYGFHEQDLKVGSGLHFCPYESIRAPLSSIDWSTCAVPTFSKDIETMLNIQDYYVLVEYNQTEKPIVTISVRARVPRNVTGETVLCPEISIAAPLSNDQVQRLRVALPTLLSTSEKLPPHITGFLRQQ